MRPLCWMKMVSLVRLPWMIGGLHACRKLQEGRGVGTVRWGGYSGHGGMAGASPGPHLSADRICVHQRFQAWWRMDSIGPVRRGGRACAAQPPCIPAPAPTRSCPQSCPSPTPLMQPQPSPHTRAFMALWFFLVFLRNCLRLPEDTYSVMKMTCGAGGLRQLQVGPYHPPSSTPAAPAPHPLAPYARGSPSPGLLRHPASICAA